jgi:hypothetical protein
MTTTFERAPNGIGTLAGRNRFSPGGFRALLRRADPLEVRKFAVEPVAVLEP